MPAFRVSSAEILESIRQSLLALISIPPFLQNHRSRLHNHQHVYNRLEFHLMSSDNHRNVWRHHRLESVPPGGPRQLRRRSCSVLGENSRRTETHAAPWETRAGPRCLETARQLRLPAQPGLQTTPATAGCKGTAQRPGSTTPESGAHHSIGQGSNYGKYPNWSGFCPISPTRPLLSR